MKGFYDRTLDSAADLADNLMLINARERVTREVRFLARTS